ncbi:MAG: PspC domain-containing protein [Melioribacteraceae bacterium]|nr:PspC domain-containing protein [Melioribacteraceae bacterium]
MNNELNNTEKTISDNNTSPEFGNHSQRVLLRSQSDKIITGLCGGIADYTKLDSTFIRILFVLLILLGGWGIVIYLIASLFVPSGKEDLTMEKSEQRKIIKENRQVLSGSILLIVGLFFTLELYGIIEFFYFAGIPPVIFWSLSVIIAGVYLFKGGWNELPKTEFSVLNKSATHKRIAGICGGMAKYMHIDTGFMRIVWLIGTFLTFGTGIIIYLILWLALPAEGEKQ